LFFVGNDGNFYGLNTPQTNTELLNTTLLNAKTVIEKEPISLSKSDIPSACVTFKDNVFMASIGDKVLVYSWIYRTWGVYDGINARSFLVDDNETLFGSENGYTYKFDVGYNDDGSAISAYYYSKHYDMGQASRVKMFRSFYVVSEAYEGVDSSVRISFEVDYKEVVSAATIEDNISRWGSTKFGQRFINWNIAQSLPVIINRRGRLIRYVFENDVIDEPFKIYEINGEYDLRGYR